ncbi:aromatic-ring hydroxylase C-terminal domain-containing protein [Pseudonocardia adelaidensis]|uniref:aromatic-ring hydroxylase C-terminal domain-containing protein n=1 Tax=Pseudonocardia adelaidensis TaxID=648754 RepID=UPI0031ECE626
MPSNAACRAVAASSSQRSHGTSADGSPATTGATMTSCRRRPGGGTEPLLIRPGVVVAWAGGDRDSLDTALDTWFGRRIAVTTAPDR